MLRGGLDAPGGLYEKVRLPKNGNERPLENEKGRLPKFVYFLKFLALTLFCANVLTCAYR